MLNNEQIKIHNEIIEQLDFINKSNLSWIKRSSCLVCLSYEYFNIGLDEKGINLLLDIPKEYFEKELVNELKEDKNFLLLVNLLLDLMMKSSYVQKDQDIKKIFFSIRSV